jgi:hypothetical protein
MEEATGRCPKNGDALLLGENTYREKKMLDTKFSQARSACQEVFSSLFSGLITPFPVALPAREGQDPWISRVLWPEVPPGPDG